MRLHITVAVPFSLALSVAALAGDDLKQGPGATPQGAWGTLPPAPPVEKRELEVRVKNGDHFDTVAKITTADLQKLKALPGKGPGGKATIYSLKDVVGHAVAAKARVVTVHLGDGQSVAVDDKAWADASRTPVLWQNRRGFFKLGWIDKTGHWMPATMELRDVRSIDVVK